MSIDFSSARKWAETDANVDIETWNFFWAIPESDKEAIRKAIVAIEKPTIPIELIELILVYIGTSNYRMINYSLNHRSIVEIVIRDALPSKWGKNLSKHFERVRNIVYAGGNSNTLCFGAAGLTILQAVNMSKDVLEELQKDVILKDRRALLEEEMDRWTNLKSKLTIGHSITVMQASRMGISNTFYPGTFLQFVKDCCHQSFFCFFSGDAALHVILDFPCPIPQIDLYNDQISIQDFKNFVMIQLFGNTTHAQSMEKYFKTIVPDLVLLFDCDDFHIRFIRDSRAITDAVPIYVSYDAEGNSPYVIGDNLTLMINELKHRDFDFSTRVGVHPFEMLLRAGQGFQIAPENRIKILSDLCYSSNIKETFRDFLERAFPIDAHLAKAFFYLNVIDLFNDLEDNYSEIFCAIISKAWIEAECRYLMGFAKLCLDNPKLTKDLMAYIRGLFFIECPKGQHENQIVSAYKFPVSRAGHPPRMSFKYKIMNNPDHHYFSIHHSPVEIAADFLVAKRKLAFMFSDETRKEDFLSIGKIINSPIDNIPLREDILDFFFLSPQYGLSLFETRYPEAEKKLYKTMLKELVEFNKEETPSELRCDLAISVLDEYKAYLEKDPNPDDLVDAYRCICKLLAWQKAKPLFLEKIKIYHQFITHALLKAAFKLTDNDSCQLGFVCLTAGVENANCNKSDPKLAELWCKFALQALNADPLSLVMAASSALILFTHIGKQESDLLLSIAQKLIALNDKEKVKIGFKTLKLLTKTSKHYVPLKQYLIAAMRAELRNYKWVELDKFALIYRLIPDVPQTTKMTLQELPTLLKTNVSLAIVRFNKLFPENKKGATSRLPQQSANSTHKRVTRPFTAPAKK